MRKRRYFVGNRKWHEDPWDSWGGALDVNFRVVFVVEHAEIFLVSISCFLGKKS